MFNQPPMEKHRGFCWEGIHKDVAADSFFIPLKEYNTNWISQTPFIWQPQYNEPEMHVPIKTGDVGRIRRRNCQNN